MAASLLDPYDWDNLAAEEMTTVVKVLCQATQERFNVAAIKTDGTYFSLGVPTEAALSTVFPYESNTGLDFELNDGDPLEDFSGKVEQLLSRMAKYYADIDKWDDDDTNSSTSADTYRLSDAADAPLTYPNRLLEVAGYEDYPDLSVYAPEEVKKWYDILTTCKYIYRTTGYQAGGGYRILEGEFDIGTEPFYNIDDPVGQDADFFGIDETSADLEADSNTTPYSDLKTANSNFPDTFSSTYNEDTEGADYPHFDSIYGIQLRRDADGGPSSGPGYICSQRSFKHTQVIDWDDMRTTVGFNGKPLSYKYMSSVEISETFPTGNDTNMSYPYSTTADHERFYCDLTVSEPTADTTEIDVDWDLSGATMPTNLTDIGGDERIEVEVTKGNTIEIILEFWDGEDGFDYYTPSP